MENKNHDSLPSESKSPSAAWQKASIVKELTTLRSISTKKFLIKLAQKYMPSYNKFIKGL